MGNQDKAYARIRIHKRSTLRSMCQNILSEHIGKIPFKRVQGVQLIQKLSQHPWDPHQTMRSASQD